MNPYVSVIIPSYNRDLVLCETIEQVLAQTYDGFELIIVDQSESHNLATSQYLSENANRFTYFHLDKPSLPGARNFGVHQSKGEIVLFLDDDVLIDSSFIESHVQNFKDPRIGGVSGAVIERDQQPITTNDVGKITFWGRVVGNKHSTVRTQIQWASGGNSSFRRKLILEAGGFDENFGGNAIFEDVDFSFRLRKLGYQIIFDPDAKIIHLAENSGGCKTRTKDESNYYYWFIRNKTVFFVKNMEWYKFPLLIITNFGRVIKSGLIHNHSLKDTLLLANAMLDGFKVATQKINE